MWFLFLSIGCQTAIESTRDKKLCNGLSNLCERRVNEVVFLRTHNSHASSEEGYPEWVMNHFYGITRQLNDGVRALNVDVYFEDDQLWLCHNFCALGKQPLEEALTDIYEFLNAHPNDVLQMDFQDEAPAEMIAEQIAEHSISQYAYSQKKGEQWPTLQELIDVDQRIFFFGSTTEDSPAWMMHKHDFFYNTESAYSDVSELDCQPQKEPFEFGLYGVIHIITDPLPHPQNAELINYNPMLRERVLLCLEDVGFINQLSVDFYSIGDALSLVAELNQFTNP